MLQLPPRSVLLTTGYSGCGKTVLARAVATAYGIPLTTFRDKFKALFEDDKSRSARFIAAAEGELLHEIQIAAYTDKSLVVAAPWQNSDDASMHILKIAKEYQARLIQVHCSCPPRHAYEQYKICQENDEPGYTKVKDYKDFHRMFIEGHNPLLTLPGFPTILVDMVNPHEFNVRTLTEKIQNHVLQPV